VDGGSASEGSSLAKLWWRSELMRWPWMRIVQCKDCGFCGIRKSEGGHLTWFEFDEEERRAGWTLGWKHLKCLYGLHEWQELSILQRALENYPQERTLREVARALNDERTCKEFFPCHPGHTPEQHVTLRDSLKAVRLSRAGVWIGALAALFAAIAAGLAFYRFWYGM